MRTSRENRSRTGVGAQYKMAVRSRSLEAVEGNADLVRLHVFETVGNFALAEAHAVLALFIEANIEIGVAQLPKIARAAASGRVGEIGLDVKEDPLVQLSEENNPHPAQ